MRVASAAPVGGVAEGAPGEGDVEVLPRLRRQDLELHGRSRVEWLFRVELWVQAFAGVGILLRLKAHPAGIGARLSFGSAISGKWRPRRWSVA